MAEAAASLRSMLVARPRSAGSLPFSVATASTAVSRSVALHVLFSTSMSQLRRGLLRFLRRLQKGVVPAVSLLRPRGAPGTVAVAALLAVVIRRVADVRPRARSEFRRRFWRDMMRCALTYEDWAHAAKMLEKEMPRAGESGLYDDELVRNKLQELRLRLREGSLRDMVFYLRTDLLRNLGNMCNPKLYNGRLQVPKLIKDYIDEVSGQLKFICESKSEELKLEEKLAFVHETRHAFGRTALLLSGGATLTAFHLGVVKVLVDNKLLPRILAGSSGGSIICAIIASKSRAEIESFFEDSMTTVRFFDQIGGVLDVMRRVLSKGAIHEIRQLQRLVMDMTGNMTFQEAYDRTGRVLAITVTSPRPHEPGRCLNYLTSPNVLIWSAVTASCAFPGIFEAQELMAKDRFGNVVPYHAPFLEASDKVASAPSARRWRDGTLESDLPMMQLKELFNVNHYIVSQANPHISPWLRVKEIARSYGGDFSGKLANLMEMEVKHRFSQLLELGLPLGVFAKLFTQDWEGDITLVMPATLAQYSKIVVNPTFRDLKMAINQGSRCTWEKLSAIKATCAIEFALDESAVLLKHMRRIQNSTERAAATSESTPTSRPSIHRRIPSWNFAARENKTNCIEEDVLADFGRRVALPSPKVCKSPHCRAEEGAAAEEADNYLNSWTRCGGPLMRTASAKRFANFVQSLDIAAVKASQRAGFVFDGANNLAPDSNRFPPTPSIIFSDGDLLQPEKVGNGFVLNVVKKEDYILTPKAGNPEERDVPYTESAADCCEHMESDSSSSGSECGDDDEAQLSSVDAMGSFRDCSIASQRGESAVRGAVVAETTTPLRRSMSCG